MGACRRSEMTHRGNTVMPCWRTSISAGEDEKAVETQHCKSRLKQGIRATESIEIDQVKEGLVEIGLSQQALRCPSGGGQRQATQLLKRLKVRRQQ